MGFKKDKEKIKEMYKMVKYAYKSEKGKFSNEVSNDTQSFIEFMILILPSFAISQILMMFFVFKDMLASGMDFPVTILLGTIVAFIITLLIQLVLGIIYYGSAYYFFDLGESKNIPIRKTIKISYGYLLLTIVSLIYIIFVA